MRLTETSIRRLVREALQEPSAPLPVINIDRMKPALDALMQQSQIQLRQMLDEDLAQMDQRLSDLPAEEVGDVFDEIYFNMLTKILASPPPAASTALKLMTSLLDKLTKRLSTQPDRFSSEDEEEATTPISEGLSEIILRDLLESTNRADPATWRGMHEPAAIWLPGVFYSHVREIISDEVHRASEVVMRAQRSRSFLDHAHAQIAAQDLARRFTSVQLSGRGGEPQIILFLRYLATSSIKPDAVTAQAILDKMPGGNRSEDEDLQEEGT